MEKNSVDQNQMNLVRCFVDKMAQESYYGLNLKIVMHDYLEKGLITESMICKFIAMLIDAEGHRKG